MENTIYHGTFSVRKVGPQDRGIRLPEKATGDYAVYEDPNGNFFLEKIGDRVKP